MSTSGDRPRSVKIGADERTGWSSERPRRDGATSHAPDVSMRCRVLPPADRIRYAPASLLMIVGPTAAQPVAFADRVLEERGAVLSLAKVRALLTGRVAEDELEAKANELLEAAVQKRVQAGQNLVVVSENLDPAERQRFVRIAHASRRPRHLILLEAPRDEVLEHERGPLDELRRVLDGGELGREGFQTARRLSGAALTEVKRIVFRQPPRED
jgi:predicted kinase